MPCCRRLAPRLCLLYAAVLGCLSQLDGLALTWPVEIASGELDAAGNWSDGEDPPLQLDASAVAPWAWDTSPMESPSALAHRSTEARALLAGIPIVRELQAASSRGEPSFTIPPGEYSFGSELVDLFRLNDMFVDVSGVTFWFTYGGGLRFIDCRNLQWIADSPNRPFVIDYDPPVFAQGRVVDVSNLRAHRWVDAVFDPAYPLPSRSDRLFARASTTKVAFWNPATRTIRRKQEGAVNIWLQNSQDHGHAWRIFMTGGINSMLGADAPGVGDLITVMPRLWPHSLQLLRCQGVTIQAMHIYGGTNIGIVETSGHGGHFYKQLRIGRRDGSKHLMSVNADGFHSNSAVVGATIQSSEIAYTGDDLLNIYNGICIVLERHSNTEIVVLDHKETIDDVLLPGDAFTFFHLKSLERLANVRLAASPTHFYGNNWPTRVKGVRGTLRASPYNIPVPSAISFDKDSVFLLRFESPLPDAVQPYFSLGQSLEKANRGASIRDSWLHDGYSRAGLTKATDTTIERTLFQRAGGVHIGYELHWFEGDLALADVKILDSTFEACGSPAINIDTKAKETILARNIISPSSRITERPPFILPPSPPTPPKPPPRSPSLLLLPPPSSARPLARSPPIQAPPKTLEPLSHWVEVVVASFGLACLTAIAAIVIIAEQWRKAQVAGQAARNAAAIQAAEERRTRPDDNQATYMATKARSAESRGKRQVAQEPAHTPSDGKVPGEREEEDEGFHRTVL